MAFRVRQSSIKTWMQCKRKYHYKQVEGLRKKKISRPLKFGTLVHEATETLIEGNSLGSYLASVDPYEVDSEEEDVRQTLSDIMHEYRLKYKGDGLTYMAVKRKKSEHKFVMHLCKGIELTGTIDGGARTRDGRPWLVEHKTFSKEWDESQRWRNLQSTLYYPAFEELFGVKAAGVMWDYIYSKPPSVPKLTKKTKKVSEAAIVTLPVVVNRFIAENKLKSKDCEGIIRAGEQGVDRYFQRIYTPRNPRVERVITNEAISVAKEMKAGHGTVKTRSIDRHCSWCEYEPLCRARLLGQDYKFVKRTQFYVDHDELEDIERESE